MRKLLILVVTLAFAACAAPAPEQPKAPDTQADKDAINKLRDDFVAAFNSNDAEKSGSVYAETAVVMNNGEPTVEGRAAIIEHNKMMFDQVMAKLTVKSRAMNVSGDLAFDEGTFTFEATPKAAGSKPMTSEGRYLVVLQRGADGWKVLEDIGNVSAAPAAPAAPATKTK